MFIKKPFVIFAITLITTLGLSSCDFIKSNGSTSTGQDNASENSSVDIEENTNNGQTNKENLKTPKNIYCENNVIHWDEVKEAEYYLIEIQISENNINNYNCSINSFNLDSIGWDESKKFNYRLKAMAEENSNYLDSKWSISLIGEFSVSGAVFGEKFNEYHLSKGLGCSVNLIDENSSYTSFLTGTSIFDYSKLATLTVMKYGINHGDVKFSSQKDFDSVIKEHNKEINSKANVDLIKSRETKLVAQKKMGLSLEYNGKYTKRREDETSLYNYTLKNFWQDNEICFENFRNGKEEFKLALSDKFLSEAERIQNLLKGTVEDYSILATFVKSYGTHFITSAILGGCLDLEYTLVGSKTAVEKKSSTDIGGELFVSKNYREVNIDANKKIDSNKYTSTQDINQNLRIQFTGGDNQGLFFTENNISDFLPAYSAWAKSTNDKYSQQIIDVSNGSLFCVWELLDDDKYSTLKERLDEYFDSAASLNYENLKAKLNLFYDENYIDLGDGSVESPYIIRTSEEFVEKITDNPNSHFIVMNDLDFNNAAVIPFGDFSGSIRGNIIDGIKPVLKNINIASENSENLGLFSRLSSSGKIMDLDIDNFKITYNADGIGYKEGSVGCLVGLSDGYIENCSVSNSTINGYIYKNISTSESIKLNCGAISGINRNGTIKNCFSDNNRFIATSNGGVTDGTVECNVGGISGMNIGNAIINYCKAIENEIDITLRGGKTWTATSVRLNGRAAGIVGYNGVNSTVMNCKAQKSDLNNYNIEVKYAESSGSVNNNCTGIFVAKNDGTENGNELI